MGFAVYQGMNANINIKGDNMKAQRVVNYYTRKFLGNTFNISEWCNGTKYLPHHKKGNTWFVI